MILVIDNYDSFTYNIVQYLMELDAQVDVRRNDEITVSEALSLKPDGILVSPGPCDPKRAGISVELIQNASDEGVPVLGVCLGHQAIGEAFGGNVIRAPHVRHGKTSPIKHQGAGVFKSLPSPLVATRYHSLVLDPETLPDELEVTAWSEDDNLIMGVRHTSLDVEGIQFHPESILSEHGHDLLANFLNRCAS